MAGLAMSFDQLARATMLLCVAAVLVNLVLLLFRVNSTRIRRSAWLLVVLQGWTFMPFRIDIPLPVNWLPAANGEFQLAAPAGLREPNSRVHPIAEVADSLARQAPADRGGANEFSLFTAALVLAWWVGIVLSVLVYLTRYVWFVRSAPLGELCSQAWKTELSQLVRQLEVRHSVQLRITKNLGPLLCRLPEGYVIFAPRGLWASVDSAQRRSILRHELAHAVRGDIWKSLLVRILALPQWFNPFCWWALHSFEECGEWACDDKAKGNTEQDVASYAKTLLRVGEMSIRRVPTSAAVRGGLLSRRIERMLKSKVTEDSTMKTVVLGTIMAAALFAPFARIRAMGEEAPVTEERTESRTRESELARVGLDPYRIESPDILLIESLRLLPKTPYRIGKLDVLSIVASGVDAKEPIAGTFQVELNGTVRLGRTWGNVRLEGTNLAEAADVIKQHLSKDANLLDVTVSLVQLAGVQFIAGEHLVSPDGRVDLGRLATVYVAGKTMAEAEAAIERTLADHYAVADVNVDIFRYNSKVFYVILERGSSADQMFRIPATGNETVLDAIANVPKSELPELVDQRVWLSRPDNRSGKTDLILPVDLKAIRTGKQTQTNYQLLPGDRLYISKQMSPKSVVTAAEREIRRRVVDLVHHIAGVGVDVSYRAGERAREKAPTEDRVSVVVTIPRQFFDVAVRQRATLLPQDDQSPESRLFEDRFIRKLEYEILATLADVGADQNVRVAIHENVDGSSRSAANPGSP